MNHVPLFLIIVTLPHKGHKRMVGPAGLEPATKGL